MCCQTVLFEGLVVRQLSVGNGWLVDSWEMGVDAIDLVIEKNELLWL